MNLVEFFFQEGESTVMYKVRGVVMQLQFLFEAVACRHQVDL